MSKLTMVAAFGAGYVLGARAGRERYDQIAGRAQQVWRDPLVQRKASQAQHLAAEKAAQAATSVQETVKDEISSDHADATGTSSGDMPDIAMSTPPPPTR